jgi:hypothetical protein
LVTDLQRDWISIAGFLVTLLGFIYAIRQIRMTKTAAEAARDAAQKAVEEGHALIQRFAASNAHRFIHESRNFIQQEQWDKAALRLRDLADQMAQLAFLNEELRSFVDKIREFANFCDKKESGVKEPFRINKWNEFVVVLQAKLDTLHKPFHNPGTAHDSETTIP